MVALSLLIFGDKTMAQLINLPLGSESRQYAHPRNKINKSLRSTADTLKLPFLDDFSYEGPVPDSSKWEDGGVFVNSDFPVSPPSWGVATFDGLNKFGNPYSILEIHGKADTLTSLPIHLNYSPSDSIYLSFSVQPKGRGNFPEYIDTLLLEFNTPQDSIWKWVWSNKGEDFPQKERSFRTIMIPIKDKTFLKSGFRFRFRNYAQLNGSWDHWHIDYVRIDKNRSMFDTLVSDVAFMYPGKSLLKTYQSVPLRHFFVLPVNNMSKTFNLSLVNNSNVSKSVFYGYSFFNQFGINVDFLSNKIKGPVIPDTEFIITEPTKFTYLDPGPQYEFATFRLYHMLNDNKDDFLPRNDTISYFQILSNYYALDDGTAEERIGFENAAGGYIAQRFEIITGDTLKSVQLYFNQVFDGVVDRPFYLMVWRAGNNQPGELILNEGPFQPFPDGWNKFKSYVLTNPIYLSGGTYYFGIAQGAETSIYLGFDRNINSNERIYYNQSGTWYNYSAQQGTLMIRPMFRKENDTYVSTGPLPETDNESFLSIFPNPASDFVMVRLGKELHVRAELIDLTGKIVDSEEHHAREFLFPLKAKKEGLFTVKIYDLKTGLTYSKQIIIFPDEAR